MPAMEDTDMSAEHTPHPQPHGAHGDLVNVDVHHEESDINVRAILWFVVILTAVALACHAVTYVMFEVMDRYEARNEPYVTPLAQPAGQPPPEPRLQTTPWTDLRQLRAQEQQYLHSYGWVDEKLGVARIPIAKAKELLLERGLPVRPELADPSEGTAIAAGGESNGGRTLPAGQPDRSKPAAAAPGPPAPAAAPAVPRAGGGRQ
jgi:hypothetical protein